MATKKPTPIERPCSTCSHLHEGIPCMEDGCECKVSTVAEIPEPSIHPHPATHVDHDGTHEDCAECQGVKQKPEAVAHETTPGTLEPFPGNPAVLFAGDATIQGRIGEVLAAYEDLGEPVGCEITTIDDKRFKWTGSEMAEVVAKAAAPAPEPTLSDEDVAKLRDIVNEQNPVKELPDGSVLVTIQVDADTANVMRGWGESRNEPWQLILQQTAEIGINAVVNGGSVAG